MSVEIPECVLCGEEKTPEGETRKARFYCTCGKEWILEKRKSSRYIQLLNHNISETRTKLILDSLSLFNSTLQMDELVQNFSEFVHQKMEQKNIGILLVDQDRSKIIPAAYKSLDPISKKLIKKIKFNYDLSHGIIVKSMTESKSVYYNLDSESHPFYSIYEKLTKTKSQLIIPIVFNNTPMGLLTVDYLEKDVPTQETERQILELLVGQFAVALRNSFLYDRSKKQSSHFQNLHLSALTLSKLYLDNHEEMMRMILLTASSFVDTSVNYLYEVNSEYGIRRYELINEPSRGTMKVHTTIFDKSQEWTPPFEESCYREKQVFIHFDSEEGVRYYLQLFRKNDHFSRDDFEVLNAFIALSKITIDNTKLYRKMSEQKKFEREVEIAREIQLNLLPKSTPDFPGFEFAGVMEAARGIGGDYYDFIVSPNKEEIVVCIGDVSGKGIGAGMVMATVRTILHSLVRKKPSPRELLNDINTYLYYNYKDSSTPRFMTMTILSWQPKTGNFFFSGAGHGSILIYKSKTKSIQEIETKGIILGIQSNINNQIHEGEVNLDSGDSLLLFTDGVTEALNPRGESYEDERLIQCFLKNSEKSAESILNSILSNVYEFMNNKEQHDDLTMVCIKRV